MLPLAACAPVGSMDSRNPVVLFVLIVVLRVSSLAGGIGEECCASTKFGLAVFSSVGESTPTPDA